MEDEAWKGFIWLQGIYVVRFHCFCRAIISTRRAVSNSKLFLHVEWSSLSILSLENASDQILHWKGPGLPSRKVWRIDETLGPWEFVCATPKLGIVHVQGCLWMVEEPLLFQNAVAASCGHQSLPSLATSLTNRL